MDGASFGWRATAIYGRDSTICFAANECFMTRALTLALSSGGRASWKKVLRRTRAVTIRRADIGVQSFRADRRLIVSYPKSGRTWVAFALDQCGVDVTLTHAGSSTNRRELGHRCDAIPPGLRDVPLVFLHRDPLDTAVSMFRQVTRRDLRRFSARWWRMALSLSLRAGLPPDDVDAFVLHPLYGLERVCAFNRIWLDALAGRSDCLILTYEALRGDPARAFNTVARFMGLEGTTGAALAEAGSFERMRKVEDRRRSARHDAMSRDEESRKVRRGIVGGYQKDLHPDTIAACQSTLARYGFAAPAAQPSDVRPDQPSEAAYFETRTA